MLLPALPGALRQTISQIAEPGQRFHHSPLRVQKAIHRLVVLIVPPHAVVLHHDAVAVLGPLYGIRPREVQPLASLSAHLGHAFRRPADCLQLGRHGTGIFLNQKACFTVYYALGGAAPLDEHRRKVAGRRLTDHKAVGIIAGGEQKQVRPAVPRPQRLPLRDGPGENALIAQRLCVFLHLCRVGAVADKHHAEILPSGRKQPQRVQNDSKALVPHHAAHEQKYRHALRQVIPCGGSGNVRLADTAPWHIHAVFHDMIIALIADGAQILPRAMADDPYLVARGNIGRQKIQRALLQQSAPDELSHIHIEFCVICKHQRCVHHLPDGPGQNGGHHRAMAVQQIDLFAFQPPQRFRGKGITRKIPEQPPGIHTGVAYDRERKPAVISLRVLRCHHDGSVSQLCQLLGVVDNGIGHAVDQRRKGIVQKADALGCLHTLFSFVLFCSVQARRT